MVDVEVDDSDALQATDANGVSGGNCDVVEEAEAHGVVGHRVMARRTDQAEGAFDPAVEEGIRGGEAPPDARRAAS